MGLQELSSPISRILSVRLTMHTLFNRSGAKKWGGGGFRWAV